MLLEKLFSRIETFHSKVISDARDAIGKGEIEQFVADYSQSLRGDPSVLEVVKELSASDGEVSDSEAKLLKLLDASLK